MRATLTFPKECSFLKLADEVPFPASNYQKEEEVSTAILPQLNVRFGLIFVYGGLPLQIKRRKENRGEGIKIS
jgi:hypothetical protein